MDLTKINKHVESLDDEPPFDDWHPTNCGDIDIVIKPDGTWLHEGKAITRLGLVKLLARVLIKENGDYFLKTPVEKMRIQVEDAPFVVTQWRTISNDKTPEKIEVTTNLGNTYIIDSDHPITAKSDPYNNPCLYVTLHRQLTAKVHRNVYYQWAEIAQEKNIEGIIHMVLESGNQNFSLGALE
ncbi:MAG: DUF1285 domain-containing protein [Gammaproteobacteria bacterium]|nr:DUF1285 domain-containing protein [Gammaproteobacteria bacterium]